MRNIFLYISLALLLPSCMKESESFSTMNPLKVTPVFPAKTTKALVNDGNLTSQQIGVQLTNISGNTLYQTGIDNTTLTYNSSWIFGATVGVSSAPAKIYAYSPYSSVAGDFSGTGETAARLLNIQAYQDMTNQTDYLWAAQSTTTAGGSNSISNLNPTVSLQMNHSLAQVSFVIYKSNYTGAGNLTQVKIKDIATSSFKISKSGTNDLKMKLSDGTISGGSSSYAISATNVGNTISLTADPGSTPSTLDELKNAYILFAPVTIADQTSIRFLLTIDGKTYSISTGGTGSLSWQKGNQYIYTLKLSETLTMESVTVAPWISNTVSNTDISGPTVIPTSKPANCHILAPGKTIIIPVGVKGEGKTGYSPITHTASSVSILWQTTTGLVTLGTLNSTNQTISVSATSASITGNALIAAYDSDGTTILWSWHIWVTDYNPDTGKTYKYTNLAGVSNEFMDRNLGATSTAASDVNSYGMLYQWGRKEPFPGSSEYNNAKEPSYVTITKEAVSVYSNLSNAIKHPMTFYTNNNSGDWYTNGNNAYDGNKGLWNGYAFGLAKSTFDPCPSGWRVPSHYKTNTSSSPFSGMERYSGSLFWNTNGYAWTSAGIGFFPAAGTRGYSLGNLNSVGSNGNFWTSSCEDYYNAQGNYFWITSSGANFNYGARATGASVRCVREW